MALAIFDLDQTLLDGDSDYLWGIFLSKECGRDVNEWKQRVWEFDREYIEGKLDINDYLDYAMQTLTWKSKNELIEIRERFRKKHIAPRISQSAQNQVAWHAAQDHQIIIATATNRFVAEATHAEINSDVLLATEPEEDQNEFTGVHGQPPCFGRYKIDHLMSHFGPNCLEQQETWFYSDSINDLPLLESVTYPNVINPDTQLAQVATERSWPVSIWKCRE